MKNKIVFVLPSIFITVCFSDGQACVNLPYINIRKSCPEKEIDLTDIAM